VILGCKAQELKLFSDERKDEKDPFQRYCIPTNGNNSIRSNEDDFIFWKNKGVGFFKRSS
jgi:hypothetical protein